MTLLTVAQRVADEVGLPRPGAVAASSDQLARQMFALANATVEELAEMNWPVLVLTHTFPTVVDQTAYALPSDYSRYVTDTAYLSSEYYQIRGSLTAKEWNLRQNGMSSLTGRMRYRLVGYPLQMEFVPAPQTVENIAVEYISTDIVVNAEGVGQALYVVDTDTCIVTEKLVRMGLKWRIKHAKGLDYNEDFNRYEAAKADELAKALNLPATPVAYRNPWGDDARELGSPYIPDTGYGT